MSFEVFPSEFSPYEERHYLESQTLFVKGVPVNPVMRHDFDITPNYGRDVEEIEDWWDMPFILTHTVEQIIHSQETYHQHVLRMKGSRFETLWSEEELNQRNRKAIESFMERNPDGISYTVRCLDGGAWDRSTWWGTFPSMQQALTFLGK